jgi:hypothetical protein
MTEKSIVDILGKYLVIAGHKVVCPNVNFMFEGQQDLLSVTGRGLVIEYEVKISRSDFRRDAKKWKAVAFDNVEVYAQNLPNRFFYVCPEGLIKVEELPAYAGLWYIIDGNPVIQKEAPLIHKGKHDLSKIYKKVITLYQQRHFLGGCLMTYKNREARKQYENQ